MDLTEKPWEILAPLIPEPPRREDGRERLMAWLHNFRQIVTRWEVRVENYLGFVHLGCIRILLRQPAFTG